MDINKIYNINCLKGLQSLPSECINTCVTSPPYWSLRNYGHDEQLGLERSPEEYVDSLVRIFREVKRVLRADGTVWLNLGDTYAGSGKGFSFYTDNPKFKRKIGSDAPPMGSFTSCTHKAKDLIGIPWMVAFALKADGWYLRQDIIWSKPNPMPEAVNDRCTKSHEYIFLLSKSPKYYYDQDSIKTEVADSTIRRMLQNIDSQEGSDRVIGKSNGKMKAVSSRKPRVEIDTRGGNQGSTMGIPPMAIEGRINHKGRSGYFNADGSIVGGGKANKKSVWTVSIKGFSEAHFATYPPDLIIDCIKSGCPEDGLVLDPFMGAGTTALVARKLNRNFIGFELNSEYIKIAERRLSKELGLFQ